MANVLIIDDDEDVTRLLQTHLSEEGHTVIVTHDGKEGMTQLLRSAPDLIMLDVFLPDATGYQMCNRIRMNESTKTTPIIMMTGAARFPNQQMYGRQRGANEYIFKPFNIVEVGELVHKYILPSTPALPKGPQDNLVAVSEFLKRSLGTSNGTPPAGSAMNTTPPLPEPVEEPLAAFGAITLEPHPPVSNVKNPLPHLQVVSEAPIEPRIEARVEPRIEPRVEPAASIPVPVASRDKFIPPTFGAKERFVDFNLEIFGLATRLCSTHAETYLADQLLRTSLSVGTQLQAAQFAASAAEYSSFMANALNQLREAAYWLMFTRKTGLLDKLTKTDLEKTCQSLTALLTDYVNGKKSI